MDAPLISLDVFSDGIYTWIYHANMALIAHYGNQFEFRCFQMPLTAFALIC